MASQYQMWNVGGAVRKARPRGLLLRMDNGRIGLPDTRAVAV